MLQIENEASLQAALTSEINLFVGAGFSIFAQDRYERNLPTAIELTKELCQEFDEPDLLGQQLPLISQIIKNKNKSKFNEFLIKRFTVIQHDDRYNAIENLHVSRIFTTNIDNLFSRIYSTSEKKYLNDLILEGATFRDSTAVEYLPLHGSVTYIDADFTFTPIEIASAFSNNPTQFQYLVTCIRKTPTLFLGYSLEDAGALQSLNIAFTSGPQEKGRWIQLRQSNAASEAYFRSLGFQIIVGDTRDVLDYLKTLSNKTETFTKQALSQGDFKTGKIPAISEAAVRPLADYFRGHAPIWHDILTGRVPITKKYREALNHIHASRNVLLSGLPVSGKSTILMQIAAYLDTSKIKIFEDVITPEKARAISMKVRGKGNLIVFIDNVSDSLDALDTLTYTPEIQVVGADRSVNINFGSHRFDRTKFIDVDCSDLHETDYPKIFDAIPPAIRKKQMAIPDVETHYNPSIFEFIERNVQGQSISDRYKDVLERLLRDQAELHDIFVMICYVFSCHAPVSFDVLSRFIEAGGDYRIVYDRIERLGKLLSEVDVDNGQFVDLDDSQDHFTPRSTIISETVVHMCKNSAFSRVFLRFHNNVPRLFIPRYSNFKRYGYRNGFASRVFDDWHDGEKFYLRAYQEDRTYFLKQQLAIFLGARRQFELAFKYIDEALTESHGRNPNIRHTHARLLFDANIDKAAIDPSLRGNLRQSMEILEMCHEYDKRQTNHALRFAEQSKRYAAIFPGSEANAYVDKAVGWLKEEIEAIPSLRHAKSLLRQLERI